MYYDFDGNFSINASEGQILEFSFVGYETAVVTVGSSNVINISLSLGTQLEEVIVTSLGITREKRALGYAVSEVDNSQVETEQPVMLHVYCLVKLLVYRLPIRRSIWIWN